MEAIILNIALIAAGAYFGIRNARMLSSEIVLRDYITKSPKARAWVQQYGVDESMKMARRTSIPFGLVVSVALLGFGIWNLSGLL